MPWGRWFIGHVRGHNLVHSTYANAKDERMYWDTQCGLRWGDRNNYRRDIFPKVTRKPVTCIECLGAELRIGGWAERTTPR